MRERLVSVLAGRAIPYLNLKKPSELIPFVGEFPILGAYDFKVYVEEVEKKTTLEQLTPEDQRITLLGNKIALMEKSFKEHLKKNEINFSNIDSKSKTKHLKEWLEKDGLSLDDLKIK